MEYGKRKQQLAMDRHQGEDPHGSGLGSYRVRADGRTRTTTALSHRVPNLGSGLLWDLHCGVGRQTMKVRTLIEPLDQEFPCKNRVQKWAATHALQLITWAIFGIVGWL